MIGRESVYSAIYRRIARRFADILDAARERETRGQSLALDIDARFRLQDIGAVQFQLASALLEETRGLRQEEVVTELLTLGLATVLQGAARVVAENELEPELAMLELAEVEDADDWSDELLPFAASTYPSARVVN